MHPLTGGFRFLFDLMPLAFPRSFRDGAYAFNEIIDWSLKPPLCDDAYEIKVEELAYSSSGCKAP